MALKTNTIIAEPISNRKGPTPNIVSGCYEVLYTFLYGSSSILLGDSSIKPAEFMWNTEGFDD
jgi:hypothetical protein